jgi:hypothetical protein
LEISRIYASASVLAAVCVSSAIGAGAEARLAEPNLRIFGGFAAHKNLEQQG